MKMDSINGHNGVNRDIATRPGGRQVRGNLVRSNVEGGRFDSRRESTSEEAEAFDPSTLLHSLRRRWVPALLIGIILGPLLAAAAWFLLIPKHAAIAYLRIDSVNAPLVFRTVDQEGGGRGSFDVYKNTQRK